MSFAEKVKKLLKEGGMTKADLAKDAKIAYTTLDSMLKRDTDTDRLATIFRIADALGTSVESLVFDEDTKEISPEEERVLKLYSLLDARGKDTVLSLLEKEADNSREKKRALPLYEAPAAAGASLPIFTEKQKMLTVFEREVPENASFAIRLAGNSMEPLFFDGDLVYVEEKEEIASGEIGIFVLNGESLCKQFRKKDGDCFLVSLNPEYAPIHILDTDDLRLVGKVIAPQTEREDKV